MIAFMLIAPLIIALILLIEAASYQYGSVQRRGGLTFVRFGRLGGSFYITRQR